jgi:hypothetical protein
MNNRLILLLASCLLLLNTFAQDNSAEYQIKSMSVTLYTGISVPVRGIRYYNDGWEPEYLVGGNVFFHINNYLLAGIRVNFNHWLASPKGLTKNYPSSVDWTSIKGHANVIEIVPSFRIILSDEYNKTNLFLQFGGGFFNLQGTYLINGTILDNLSNSTAYYYIDNKTFHFNKAGLNLGLGIKAGKIEIFPLYSVIFTPEDPTHFVTLNLGYHF